MPSPYRCSAAPPPAVALYFKTLGQEQWFYYYLSGMIFISLIIYATMRDTKHESAMHRHE
jgi:MHS family alpha-ketoglutarate permease-like MFS transporter